MEARNFVHDAMGNESCDLLIMGGSNAQESVDVSRQDAERIASESNGRIVLGEKVRVSRIRSRPQHGGTKLQIALDGEPRVTVEILLDQENRIERGVPAGSAVTLAVTSRLLGVPEIVVISASGSGNRGDDIRDALATEGISRQVFLPSTTTAYTLALREPGGRVTLVMQKPAWDKVQNSALQNIARRSSPAAFACTGIIPDQHALEAMETLWHACPKETLRILSPHRTSCANPHARDLIARLIPKADLFTVNEAEFLLWFNLPAFPPSEMDQGKLLQRINARRVVITRNSKGSIAWERDGGHFLSQPAIPVAVVGDTVGAGDVHLAACVRGMMQGLPLPKILLLAAKVAAEKISFRGHGVPYLGVPDRARWDAWVKEDE